MSLAPIAGGIVMPGVHDGAPVGALQVPPTVPPVGVQSDPSQQTFGCGEGWGVHIRGGSQPPVESQRQPFDPTMQVVGEPPGVPASPFASPP